MLAPSIFRAWLVGAALLLTAAGARGDPGIPAPPASDPDLDLERSAPRPVALPYAAWEGDELELAPRAPAQPEPQPVTGRPTHARRSFELVAATGPYLLLCRGSPRGGDPCQGLQPLLQVGLAALWRVHPHFAWGGSFERAGRIAPLPPGPGVPRAGALFVGWVGRVYARDEGRTDPYLQLELGYGVVERAFAGALGNGASELAAGPTIRAGAGIDYSLGTHLRLGPALTLTQGLVERLHRCEAPANCSDVTARGRGHVTTSATLVGRVSIALGRSR